MGNWVPLKVQTFGWLCFWEKVNTIHEVKALIEISVKLWMM